MIDKEITLNSVCMGCHSCMNICPRKCISMEMDEEGFLYPKVDYNICITCNRCINACPTLIVNETFNIPSAFACLNTNEKIRLESSSGGIFTLIAEDILDQNGLVFGARFTDNFELEHDFVEGKKDLVKFRGSKYLQSKIGDTYSITKNFLDLGRTVMFSGTPCQISGLYSFLETETYSNLVTIDLICHGVPSPKVWNKYVAFRQKKAKSEIQRIAFRNKFEGWKRFSVSFQYKDNTEYRKNLLEDLYMRVFLKDICLRPSCYSCRFKSLSRKSDITLADFWGIENILPEMDDDKGTSLVFVNSEKGQEIFNRISKHMKFKEVDIYEAIKYNPAAIKSAYENPKRSDFFKDIEILEFDQLIKKHVSDVPYVQLKNKVKSIIRLLLIKVGLFKAVKNLIRIK